VRVQRRTVKCVEISDSDVSHIVPIEVYKVSLNPIIQSKTRLITHVVTLHVTISTTHIQICDI
jgi:hypothetical protein